MVTVGGQIRPYVGDNGPVNSVSGRVELTSLSWRGVQSTTAKASFASGQFIEIFISGGGRGYIEYLVSA